MAGMRIGYGVFPLEVIKHLWKIKQPYTPTVASSIGAIAALQDREHLRDNVQRIVEERQRMSKLLSELGWLHIYPSETNFLLCRVTSRVASADGSAPGQHIKTYLERQGILVRYFDKDGLRDCFRISIGKPEHTDKLLRALKAVRQ
jgi:histidinol-phosphate aminotransferase